MSNKVSVGISKDLFDEIQRRINESGGEFSNVEAFIEFVLTEVLREDEPENDLSPEEEKEIKKRLSALGYIE